MENNQPSNQNPNPEKTEQQEPAPSQLPAPVVQPALPAPADAPPPQADQMQQSSQAQPKPEVPADTTQKAGAFPFEPLDAEQLATAGQQGIEQEKRQHNIVLVEAALYVAGRPLDLNELCSALSTRSKKKAEAIALELAAEYAKRNSAIEILQLKDERFVMQVRSEFTPLVKKLVNRPLLSSGPLKTLSYVAYRQPVTSKRVIEVRGQHAYGHIKLLREMDLVATERQGRQVVLKTTDYFADYFGLTMDTTTLKRDLKRIFGEALKEETLKDQAPASSTD